MKKRNLIKIMIVTAVVGMLVTACGSADESSDIDKALDSLDDAMASTQQTSDYTGEISKESLMSMPANEETDFEGYVDEEAGEYVITGYIGESELVVVPDTIEGSVVGRIQRVAFSNNNGTINGGSKTSIRAMKVPDSLHTLESEIFTNCKDLELFVPGSGLKVINGYAFSNTSITTFEFPEGIEIVEFGALGLGNQMEGEIYLPSSIKEARGCTNFPIVVVEHGSYVAEYLTEFSEENSSSEQQIIYK